jgi:hypothetical protein
MYRLKRACDYFRIGREVRKCFREEGLEEWIRVVQMQYGWGT